jgi:hypothetical protein
VKTASWAWLVFQAFYELARYDLVHGLCRARIRSRPLRGRTSPSDAALEATICEAVALACCFYWKPVLCLQRSVSAMRLLRVHGVGASVVVGYRPAPFFSHAWVEVDGRVVNDSPAYKRQLHVLHTI